MSITTGGRTRRFVFSWTGVLLSVLVASCRDVNVNVANYNRAIQSGLDTIPEARQIEEVLGEAHHSISYHGSRSVGNDWNTEVYLYGRYELLMQVPVRMGYQFDEVLEVAGEPQFYLLEVQSIEYYGNDRRPGASYAQGDEWPYPFGAEEWAKVYAADGDFSVIGIELNKEAPVDGFEDYMNAKLGIESAVDERDN